MFRPRFCAACGGSLDAELRCDRCGRRHFLNSKPCVGAIVLRRGRLLLVRRGREPFKDWWDVPGGFLEPGEHPEDGTTRELREETGLEVRPRRLVGIYMDEYGDEGDPTLNLFYECDVTGGTEAAADDAVEIGWFDPASLPERIAFASARRMLADWQRTRA